MGISASCSFVVYVQFFSDKFDITRHKRYKELSDYDKKNSFDVEAYMKHQLKLQMKEEFDLFEVEGKESV